MFETLLYLMLVGIAVVLVVGLGSIILVVALSLWCLNFFNVDLLVLIRKEGNSAFVFLCEKVVETVHQAAWRGERLLSRTTMVNADYEQKLRATFAEWKESHVTRIGPHACDFSLRFNTWYLNEAPGRYLAKGQADEWHVFVKETIKLRLMLRLFRHCVIPLLCAD